MESQESHCNNCGAPVSGAYCGQCGQRAVVQRVTFSETFSDLVSGMFTLDAPIIHTLVQLFSNPGTLFREYLGGKRKSFYKPVSFFILASFVYLLIRSAIGFDPFKDSSIQTNGGVSGTQLTEARDYMLLHIDKFLFLFVITLGCWLKIFFYTRYHLAEFFAVSFYLIGVYTFIVTLNMFYIQYIGDMQFFGLFAMWVYFIISMIAFFQTRKILTAVKSFFTFLFAFIFYMMIAYGLSYLIVALF